MVKALEEGGGVLEVIEGRGEEGGIFEVREREKGEGV